MKKLWQTARGVEAERAWNLAFWASLAACEAVGLYLAHA